MSILFKILRCRFKRLTKKEMKTLKITVSLGISCVMALYASLFAYFIYTPLPSGLAEPIKCQAFSIAFTIGTFIGKGSSYITNTSSIDNIRFLMRTFMDHGFSSSQYGDVQITETEMSGVPVVIYRPSSVPKTGAPAMLFFHGGGFVFGSPATYDLTAYEIAKTSKTVLINVDYRLAPEHPFPSAIYDAINTTKYLLQNGEDYGIDVTKVGVTGDSAGGNLAAATALYLSKHDLHLPALRYQVLIYPVLQFVDLKLPSYVDNEKATSPLSTAYFLSSILARYLDIPEKDVYRAAQAIAENRHVPDDIRKSRFGSYININYLPERYRQSNRKIHDILKPDIELYNMIEGKLSSPLFSPLVADDLSKLPPTFINVAEFDILRDDGLLYAERLRESGVKVHTYTSVGGFHGELQRLRFKFFQAETGTKTIIEATNFIKYILAS